MGYLLIFLFSFKVPLSEFDFSWSKISDIQAQVSLSSFTPNKAFKASIKRIPSSIKITNSRLLMFLCVCVCQLEKLIEKNYYLHKSAQEAYKSYVRAYDSHSLKQIYDVQTLNLPQVALSFGFKVPPYVDLSILSIFCSYVCFLITNCIQCFSYNTELE